MPGPQTRLCNDARLSALWRGLEPLPAWVTGGYVRDVLLGRPSSDIDLVVDSAAGESEAVARSLEPFVGARAHLIGRPPRAVWRLQAPGTTVDLWPLDGLPLSEDASRRDFTCNALLWRLPAGPMVDLVGGLTDIANRTLRAVSAQNLRGDPIRLLRAARFLSELEGFRLDAGTARWLPLLAPALNRAPRERIGEELLALLRGSAPAVGLTTALRAGLLTQITPPGAPLRTCQFARLVPTASALAHPRRHPVPASLEVAGDAARIGLLMTAWGVRSADEVAAFAWPRDLRSAASRAAAHLEQSLAAVTAPAAQRRRVIFASGEAFPAVVALAGGVAAAAGLAFHPWRRWWRQWLRSGPNLLGPTPLLNGNQLMELLDLRPGPELGLAASDLLEAQIRGQVRSVSGAIRWLRRRSGSKAAVT